MRLLSGSAQAATGAGGSAIPTAATGGDGTVTGAAARRAILHLWRQVSQSEMGDESHRSSSRQQGAEKSEEDTPLSPAERCAAVEGILNEYQLDGPSSFAATVGAELGESLDRLLLLCVPLSLTLGDDTQRSLQVLERVLSLHCRGGRSLSVRAVQHLFARTESYAEALAVFHTMRCAHVALNMETYYAMLYALQRLEEEGWALQFRNRLLEQEELKLASASTKAAATANTRSTATTEDDGPITSQEDQAMVTEQAIDFVMRGIASPLMPENKPWLGSLLYPSSSPGLQADSATHPSAVKQTASRWDDYGKLWLQRYKGR